MVFIRGINNEQYQSVKAYLGRLVKSNPDEPLKQIDRLDYGVGEGGIVSLYEGNGGKKIRIGRFVNQEIRSKLWDLIN
jgi:hypothetical protein